jgi:hypothetical protein
LDEPTPLALDHRVSLAGCGDDEVDEVLAMFWRKALEIAQQIWRGEVYLATTVLPP